MTQKERNLAKGQDCTLRISGYGGCSGNDTVVLCHAPCRDDGKSFKSPDRWAAFGCFKCHGLIDRQTKMLSDMVTLGATKRHLRQGEIDAAWNRGIYETQKIMGVFTESEK